MAGAFWDQGAAARASNQPPPNPHSRSAEELLRSGGFALVVLAGAEPRGAETVRLTRATRDGGSALSGGDDPFRHVGGSSSPHAFCRRTTTGSAPHLATPRRSPLRAFALPPPRWDGNPTPNSVLPVMHHELRLSLEPQLAGPTRGVSR